MSKWIVYCENVVTKRVYVDASTKDEAIEKAMQAPKRKWSRASGFESDASYMAECLSDEVQS